MEVKRPDRNVKVIPLFVVKMIDFLLSEFASFVNFKFVNNSEITEKI